MRHISQRYNQVPYIMPMSKQNEVMGQTKEVMGQTRICTHRQTNWQCKKRQKDFLMKWQHSEIYNLYVPISIQHQISYGWCSNWCPVFCELTLITNLLDGPWNFCTIWNSTPCRQNEAAIAILNFVLQEYWYLQQKTDKISDH